MTDFASVEKLASQTQKLGGPVQGKWLFDLVMDQPKEWWVCEVGAFYGYMTAVLAGACSANQRLISIDHMIGGSCDYTEGSKCVYIDYIDHLRRCGVWDRVIPMPMKSEAAIDLLQLIRPILGVTYLDGCHQVAHVFSELTRLDQFIPIGGVVCGDDCTLQSNVSVYHPEITFNSCWDGGLKDEFQYDHVNPEWGGGGAPWAVWNFFRGNDRYKPLPNVPGNQFGFRKVS